MIYRVAEHSPSRLTDSGGSSIGASAFFFLPRALAEAGVVYKKNRSLSAFYTASGLEDAL